MRVKTLLIVYKEKDEAYFNQLKDLIEANDDGSDNTVGVEDGTVHPYKCSEKQWLEHKSKGRENKLAEKVLFIDDIKDTTLPKPIYNKYGISYGPIDKRHFAIIVDEKYAWDEDTYTEFRLELQRLTNDESIASNDVLSEQKATTKKIKKKGAFAALGLLMPVSLVVAGGLIAKDLSDAKKNADVLRNQMLYFAINKVYKDELDKFMKT